MKFKSTYSVVKTAKGSTSCRKRCKEHLSGILMLSGVILFSNKLVGQTLIAQSDLFNVLQNTCSNYLDATVNDNLDSIALLQIQIISQPVNGTASTNGNYLSYCPQQGFLGVDQFQYSVGDSLRADTATVYINVLPPNNQVNPGDADQNGKVENFDVLAIGLAYGTLGPARSDSIPNASLAWLPLSFINSDPGAADCNGDGIVDATDVLVIDSNFNNAVSVPDPYEVDTSICDVDGIPFYVQSLTGDSIIDGDTLILSLRLGNDFELHEAYGIAFTLEFDNRFIPGNQVQLQTTNSWLLQNDAGLSFKRDIQLSGEINITLSKTNHNPAIGSGEIMRAIVPIDDNIDGIPVAPGWHDLLLNLSAIRLISEYDIVRDVCVQESSVKVFKLTTSARQLKNGFVKIYPNPSNGSFIVEGEELLEITITDLAGKEIITSRLNKVSKAVIDVNEVAAGSYFVTVRTRESVLIKKLFIQP